MIAFGLSIGLFVFWAFVGYAVIGALYRRNDLLQSMLLAPAVGTAITLLPVFWLSRLGLPVRQFGTGTLFAILLLTVVLLRRFRQCHWQFPES